MRHSFTLVFIILFLAQFACAQDDQTARDWFIGGTFSFGSTENQTSNSNSTNLTNINISPYVGKDINDSWSLILSPNFGYNKNKSNDDRTGFERKTTTNIYGLSVAARYMINPKNRFNAFLRPSIFYSHQRSKTQTNNNPTSETKGNIYGGSIGLGGIYNISDRWRALINAGSLRYSRSANKDSDFKTSTFGAFFGLSSLSWGVEYRF